MPKSLPNKIVVLVDRREKQPILFPNTLSWFETKTARAPKLIRVEKKVIDLPAGDYAIQGYDDVALIERKGSLDEIAQNMLTQDHARCERAFQRLVEACEFPYLLLDMSIRELWSSSRVEQPERAIQCLFQLAASKGIRVLFGGNSAKPDARRKLGKTCLTLLWSHAMLETCGPIDILGMTENLHGKDI